LVLLFLSTRIVQNIDVLCIKNFKKQK